MRTLHSSAIRRPLVQLVVGRSPVVVHTTAAAVAQVAVAGYGSGSTQQPASPAAAGVVLNTASSHHGHLLERSPYSLWLRTIALGASFGLVLLVTQIIWTFAGLGSRVRGTPSPGALRQFGPYFSLGFVSLHWIAVWLLTAEEPSLQPVRRFRANLLRGLVTLAFLLVSVWTLQLLGNPRNLNRPVNLATAALDFVSATLLWTHIAWMAGRLEFRGLKWRAVVTLILTTATLGGFVLGPRMAYPFEQHRYGVTPQFQNLRGGLLVLSYSVGAIVMARLALSAWGESRR